MDEIAQTIMDDEEEEEKLKQNMEALNLDKDKQIPLDEIPDLDDIPDMEDDEVIEEDDPVSLFFLFFSFLFFLVSHYHHCNNRFPAELYM